MAHMKLGIIGGSGLYRLEGLTDVESVTVKTPFGAPSDALLHGRLNGRELYFLPRHGQGHRLLPGEIPHRANIFALKELGCAWVLSVSAVGSLREGLQPRDVVLPDQYYDRTKSAREHTFFGNGIVAHVSFGDPACAAFRKLLAGVVEEMIKQSASAARLFPSGTYVNMEGPAFSTRAESETYRKLGFDVIGMTSLAEAKLCREAEICYQAMAMVTDFDCWHRTEEEVSVEAIIGHLQSNVVFSKQVISELARRLPEARDCACTKALKYAIMTDPAAIPESVRKSLAPLIGRYVQPSK
ncbi:MAG: S-methyl-5'-thioadenosine phosphorylase [bacterium]